MPLVVEHPDAANSLYKKYMGIMSAETILEFGSSLGDFESNGIIGHDQFTSVLDGEPVIRTYNNFTINAGHTVTTTHRCKGLYLYIKGDLTVNGILSMNARGAKGAGKFVGIDPKNKVVYFHSTDIFTAKGLFKINKVGGVRTAYPANNTNIDGNSGVDGACGSGGSGGRHINTGGGNAGRGGPGTSFSGGPGGGGTCILGTTASGGDGADDAGAGGAGNAYDNTGWIKCSGGGAGNNGGAGKAYNGGVGSIGTNGAGGLIILIVEGNIIIGPNGYIQSNGSNGGNATSSIQNDRAWGAGGGASGGGAVHVFTDNPINLPARIRALGGIGGVSNVYGGNGGPGSVGIRSIN